MLSDTRPSRDPFARVPLRAAVLIWVVFGVAVAVHVLLSPERHNLWPVFRAGGLGWWRGEDIYFTADYFRYSPAFAALLAPLAALGVAGNILFDLGGLAVYFYAVRRLVRVVFPEPLLSRNEPAVLLLSLTGVLRGAWSSQAHTWSAALIFLAAVAIVESRWWAAAFALSLAIHLKLAPIVLAAVVLVHWPQAMSWRLVAAAGAWGILPALRGGLTAAVNMYAAWFARLRLMSGRRFPSFRDVWHLAEVLNHPLSPAAYRVLQAAAGIGVVLWTLGLRARGAGRVWLVSGSFALTTAYLLALGPAVEFSQYPLLAPWVSAALVAAWPDPRARAGPAAVYCLTMVAGFGAVEDTLAGLFRTRVPEGLMLLGTLAFGAWVGWKWMDGARTEGQGVKSAAGSHPGPPDL